VTTPKLTLARAREILDTPPTVVDRFFLKYRTTWREFRKVRFEYSGIEYWQTREHSIHGVTDWVAS
jgi:hypothetical protein